MSKQAELLLNLESEVEKLNGNTISTQVYLESDVKNTIRNIIKPLGEKLKDNSVGYKSTYRKVYTKMQVNWKYRITRWNNLNENKKLLKNIDLLAADNKLLELFKKTVAILLQEN